MGSNVRGAVPFAKSVVTGISDKNVTFMAAGIAYQAFISLLPLLVLVFFLVAFVGDEALAQQVSSITEGFLPESGQVVLEQGIEGDTGSVGTSIIGIVALLWGSLKIFRGLDTAFSEIYATTDENSLVDQLQDGAVVFGAIGIALVAAALTTIVFAFFPTIPFLGLLYPLLLVVGLTLAFLPMYYRFPDADLSVRQVLPGVVVAAVGWALLQSLFQVYVAVSSSSDSAGPIGAILLLLTWLYFGGLILLVGAVVNAIHSGHLEIAPDESEAESREGIPEDAEREPFVDDGRRERERLEARLTELRRERDQLRNDRKAQRSRRYRLEDRVDDLEARIEALETENRDLTEENERLRRDLAASRGSSWRRRLRGVLARVRTLNIGVLEDRGK
ncbi:ribonuclease BN [Natrinema pellirubrum DSM 15624]|uniref:Membrane protein n=1 Tax=Natrinema pellirubrum (strain DSM 15624 / CIP 106293 / JCM 10476 / NCIMB 786 / 157) TaxID=797303 RepID=L0JPG5_NATP1|nr:YhjD/YihY/BrkB family envelope integrity protein [Natrinema pellirubrum]AGB32251.1 putative membrane protein [Natrinema pellirubrum DSM 15624]ELY74684.1 ribonuclease BN [Natrinema pellirubrum DSM 15624]